MPPSAVAGETTGGYLPPAVTPRPSSALPSRLGNSRSQAVIVAEGDKEPAGTERATVAQTSPVSPTLGDRISKMVP